MHLIFGNSNFDLAEDRLRLMPALDQGIDGYLSLNQFSGIALLHHGRIWQVDRPGL